MTNPLAMGAMSALLHHLGHGVNAPRPVTGMMLQEPHAKGLKGPTHKHKVRAKGRHPVETKGGHKIRSSATGRDRHRASDIAPKLPGLAEPGGIAPATKGRSRFADMGR